MESVVAAAKSAAFTSIFTECGPPITPRMLDEVIYRQNLSLWRMIEEDCLADLSASLNQGKLNCLSSRRLIHLHGKRKS
jgi:hypothetical protein